MVFTMPDFRRATPEESGPFNNLLSKALQNYTAIQQSRYLPRTLEADIFHKTISPLANIAISPLMTALAPTQQRQIAQYISQALGSLGVNGSIGNKSYGAQPQSYNSIIGGEQAGYDLDQAVNEENIATENQDKSFNLLPQQNQGVEGGAVASAETPFRTSPVKQGSLYQNPRTGDVLSAPTADVISQSQGVINSVKNVNPILENLIKESKPILEHGGTLNVSRGKLAGVLNRVGIPNEYTSLIGDQELANKSVKFESDIAKATDQLLGALKLPSNIESLHLIQSILNPRPYENHKGYENRVTQEIANLIQRKNAATNILGGGFNLSKDNGNYKSKNLSEKVTADRAQKEDAEHTADIATKYFGYPVSAMDILNAQSQGIMTIKQLKQWMDAKNG